MSALLALSTAGWSGLSALGGTLVGGTVTGVATYKIEGKRQRFEEGERKIDRQQEDDARREEREREDAATRAITRGVARVMRSRYERLEGAISSTLENGAWLSATFEVDPAPPIEDRKLVASAATPQEWLTVDLAEFSLSVFLAGRDVVFAIRGIPQPVTRFSRAAVIDDEATVIQSTITALARAKTALDRLAEVEDPAGPRPAVR
jgi:hypothetical protein